jgi:hypothetical protein
MSLSEAIINNDVDTVIQLVKQGASLNIIDEYGYTPLIQTAIHSSINKAAVIINAGADLNFSDLTGRTALHWAADNNNIKLCKLLLQHHANPNAYTVAGQPVLVMPILRQQKELIKLLCKHGADFDCAKDFINAKLLAHRYELRGHVDIVDKTKTFIEIDFEGFYLEFTVAVILNSLQDLRKNFGARHLRNYFKHFDKIIKSFTRASELIKYQHYNIDKEKLVSKIDKLLEHDLLIIPVGYEGHGISLLKYKNLFAHCDRGIYGQSQGTVNIYTLGNPSAFNPNFIKNLLYTRQYKSFIEDEMHAILNLTQLAQLPLSLQIAGNCSWANIEAAVPTSMFILLLAHNNRKNPYYAQQCQESAMFFYTEWLNWDKSRALQQFIHGFDKLPRIRQATKAALLAAIVFQQCDYADDDDYTRAKKIVPILVRPEFRYIVNSYIEVFLKATKTKAGKNLAELLEDFGIDTEN